MSLACVTPLLKTLTALSTSFSPMVTMINKADLKKVLMINKADLKKVFFSLHRLVFLPCYFYRL